MLILKDVKKTDVGIQVVYTLEHQDGEGGTILREDLHLVLDPDTGAILGNMHITNLKSDSMPEALEKLARWCDRFALALREPMKATVNIPVFVKDWEAIHALSNHDA
ncbi:MAG: hypothetical protein Q7S87_00855 [Agitococcus sp.]|nr:hypothetical protein [Agitococcus sp.]MDO9177150.1 hypothetical protein [Agitococcus sp.]